MRKNFLHFPHDHKAVAFLQNPLNVFQENLANKNFALLLWRLTQVTQWSMQLYWQFSTQVTDLREPPPQTPPGPHPALYGVGQATTHNPKLKVGKNLFRAQNIGRIVNWSGKTNLGGQYNHARSSLFLFQQCPIGIGPAIFSRVK